MSFGAELREYRVRHHLSQESIGEATYTSQKAISEYERGIKQPDPNFARFLRHALPSAAGFSAQAAFEARAEFVSVPYLNSVDHHVQTVLDAVIEEFEEATAAARRLKTELRNLVPPKRMLQDQRIRVMADLEQVMDTYTANKVLMVAMAEDFGIDLDELEQRHIAKLIAKGYWCR